MARLIRGIDDTDYARPRPRRREDDAWATPFSNWMDENNANENRIDRRKRRPETLEADLQGPVPSVEDLLVLQDESIELRKTPLRNQAPKLLEDMR